MAVKQSFVNIEESLQKAVGNKELLTDILADPTVPPIMVQVTGEPGWQYKPKSPQAKYPAGLNDCVSIRVAFKFVLDAVTGTLTLTKATTEALSPFSVGVGDSGANVGLWGPLGIGDSTLQKGGTFVFDYHTFIAFAHTFAFEGLYYRGGAGTADTDPLVKSILLDQYEALILKSMAHSVGFSIKAQGDECPKWMGSLIENGDRAQVFGTSAHSLSNPTFPTREWTSALAIGAKDDFTKIEGTFTTSHDQVINPIAGNVATGDVYALVRLRVCGKRFCGKLVAGCE